MSVVSSQLDSLKPKTYTCAKVMILSYITQNIKNIFLNTQMKRQMVAPWGSIWMVTSCSPSSVNAAVFEVSSSSPA